MSHDNDRTTAAVVIACASPRADRRPHSVVVRRVPPWACVTCLFLLAPSPLQAQRSSVAGSWCAVGSVGSVDGILRALVMLVLPAACTAGNWALKVPNLTGLLVCHLHRVLESSLRRALPFHR